MDKYFNVLVNCFPLVAILALLFARIKETNHTIFKYILIYTVFLYDVFCYVLYCKGYGHFAISTIFGVIMVIAVTVSFILSFFPGKIYPLLDKYDYIRYIIITFIFLLCSIYFFVQRLQMDKELINKCISDFKNLCSLIINGIFDIKIDNDLIRQIFIATMGSALAGFILNVFNKK